MPRSSDTYTNLFANYIMFLHIVAKYFQIQLDLTRIWLNDWRISVNTDITVAIVWRQIIATNIKPIKINIQDIKWMNTVIYL